MKDTAHTFTHEKHGVTFSVAVNGQAPFYRFVITASYEGVHLYTLHHLHRFEWSSDGRHTLEHTARHEFNAYVIDNAYLSAVKTAHRLKHEAEQRAYMH